MGSTEQEATSRRINRYTLHDRRKLVEKAYTLKSVHNTSSKHGANGIPPPPNGCVCTETVCNHETSGVVRFGFLLR